jgi:hypothetical protein
MFAAVLDCCRKIKAITCPLPSNSLNSRYKKVDSKKTPINEDKHKDTANPDIDLATCAVHQRTSCDNRE